MPRTGDRMDSEVTKRVILAGGGHAHLAVLADWARRPLPGAQCWLIAPSVQSYYSGMVPGWLAGRYRLDELSIALAPLAVRAGAQLIEASIVALDADARIVTLSSGDRMAFDLLSLATGGEIDCSALAPLEDRLLPIRPMDRFVRRWSERRPDAARIAVVGGGAAGVELALGAALGGGGATQVSLIGAPGQWLAGHAPAVQRRARAALIRAGVQIHESTAAGTADGLRLADGRSLPADVVIAATGSRAPGWLAQSGLACDGDGFVEVGPTQQSLSHPHIMAAGDIVTRADRPMHRSGVHAVKAGPVLAANLRALLSGAPLQSYQPRRRTLYLLTSGQRRAIISWGGLVGEGRLAWRLKDRIDRAFVRRYAGRHVQGDTQPMTGPSDHRHDSV